MRGSHEKSWSAGDYSKNSSPQFKAATEFYKQYAFKGDETILDIGSGDGKITAFLTKQVPNGTVIGIDISENMVKFARETYQIPYLTFEQSDAQSFEYHQQFDLIVTSFTLHWISDKLLVFQHIAHALKPQGCLYALLAISNTFAPLRLPMIQEGRWKKYFLQYSDNVFFEEEMQYHEYAQKAGLQIIQHELVEKTEDYETKEQLSHFLRANLPYINFLPSDDLKNEFIIDFVDRYMKTYGTSAISYRYLNLIAQV